MYLLIDFDTAWIPFQGDPLPLSEITLSTHFAYREKFVWGKFERRSLGSQYPTLDLDLTYGPKGVYGSDYEYYQNKAENFR